MSILIDRAIRSTKLWVVFLIVVVIPSPVLSQLYAERIGDPCPDSEGCPPPGNNFSMCIGHAIRFRINTYSGGTWYYLYRDGVAIDSLYSYVGNTTYWFNDTITTSGTYSSNAAETYIIDFIPCGSLYYQVGDGPDKIIISQPTTIQAPSDSAIIIGVNNAGYGGYQLYRGSELIVPFLAGAGQEYLPLDTVLNSGKYTAFCDAAFIEILSIDVLSGLYVQSASVNGSSFMVENNMSTPLLRVQGNGNVGIGETLPEKRLTVDGGDALICGDNFNYLYDKASLFLGDTTHGLTAYNGYGLNLWTHDDPSRYIWFSGRSNGNYTHYMHIQMETGRVKIRKETGYYLSGGFSHQLTIDSGDSDSTLLLYGPGTWGSGAKINFGDENFVYLKEDIDDRLTIYAYHRIALMGGFVGIGTTSPTALLTVDNGTTIGTYTITGWQHSSDRRMKKDISRIDNALLKVSEMEGVYFKWKNSQADRQVGLIAQDLEYILPEVVNQDNKGYYSISYDGVIPVLIEAIKELKKQNEVLQARIEALENR